MFVNDSFLHFGPELVVKLVSLAVVPRFIGFEARIELELFGVHVVEDVPPHWLLLKYRVCHSSNVSCSKFENELQNVWKKGFVPIS